ncbi:FAD-dependent oxidoreductase [Desulfonatronovibrio magnus]|uniref:FAD-dependent oxidoreductase n=1 Tax=Desulfonatronovibrio magnus TaxID=698827 RepID=UPI0005EAF6FD
MIAILGAGISGISAAYHLRQRGIESIVFEKDEDWGGGFMEILKLMGLDLIKQSICHSLNLKSLCDSGNGTLHFHLLPVTHVAASSTPLRGGEGPDPAGGHAAADGPGD